jgi:mRNA interferase YafQ
MRTIERSSAFRRDFKRAKAVPRHRNDLDSLLSTVITRLATDKELPTNNRDHGLSGDWVGYRECHIKPDLLLIYCKSGASALRLARLGSHSELFG